MAKDKEINPKSQTLTQVQDKAQEKKIKIDRAGALAKACLDDQRAVELGKDKQGK